jgi:hypothetical protein
VIRREGRNEGNGKEGRIRNRQGLEWIEGGEGWERTGRKREGMICRGGAGEGEKRMESCNYTPIVRNLVLFQCLLI